jgi:hypothetical protein
MSMFDGLWVFRTIKCPYPAATGYSQTLNFYYALSAPMYAVTLCSWQEVRL